MFDLVPGDKLREKSSSWALIGRRHMPGSVGAENINLTLDL